MDIADALERRQTVRWDNASARVTNTPVGAMLYRAGDIPPAERAAVCAAMPCLSPMISRSGRAWSVRRPPPLS